MLPAADWCQSWRECERHVRAHLPVLSFWNLLLIFCSSREETALHHAAENGHIQACQLLIDAKADVNARRNTGNYTPLKCAIESNKRDVVALLRSVGAAEWHHFWASALDFTALDYIFELHKSERVRFLPMQSALRFTVGLWQKV
jgi:ankyrin repeat protein